MNFFKKLFSKHEKKKKKTEDECWYNNSHEKIKKTKWTNPDDSGGALANGSQMDMGIVRGMTDRQGPR